MSTHFALGVGLAVEVKFVSFSRALLYNLPTIPGQDAYTLGRILTDDRTHLGNIAEAFKVYDETRRPLATTIARESRLTGLLYEFVAPGYYDGADRSREAEELEELKRDIEKGWSWEWDCGFADDWERSRGRLEDVLGQMA
jgi:salicylate hydroxylase